MMKKIVIPTKLDNIAKEILDAQGYEVIVDSQTPLQELMKQHNNAQALIVRSEKVTAEIIDLLPSLKTIVRAGAGYDNINTKYARAKKIDVMNTPGANANGVAEQAVGMMIAVARHFVAADQSVRSGLWEKKKFSGLELVDKTIGIIGLGAIGQLVCKRLSGFEVKLLGFDPFLSADKAKKIGIDMTSLDEVFAQSDYVSLHVPETNETKGMVNEKLLMSMKDGAVIVNCARYGIINEDDFRKVKNIKHLKLCNDVYPKDCEGDKSVKDIADIMLPHLGASTRESNYNAARRSAEQLIDLWEKGITRYVVNSIIPDGLDEKYQELAYYMTVLAKSWLQNKPVRQIEASYYGGLDQYGEWMVPPIVAALEPSFDINSEKNEAIAHLKEKGVDYICREADNSKKYGKSITIDLFCGQHQLDRLSIRGTVVEDSLMISRIADFHKLYCDPQGHHLFFTYIDRPAVLGKITSILGMSNINIHDIRAPHNETKTKSLAIIKIDKQVSDEVVKSIAFDINAETGFYVNL